MYTLLHIATSWADLTI